MIVRPLEGHQRDLAARLWRESFQATAADATLEQTGDDLFDRVCTGGWDCLLAWEGDEAVAFLAVDIKSGWLVQLFVAAAWQGRGVGQALIDEVKTMMPDGFRLRTGSANAAARRLYERSGFKLEERVTDPSGAEVKVYYWRPTSH